MKLKIQSIDIDFHQIVENSLNAIWILGTEGEILYFNKACMKLLKLTSPEDILSKKLYTFLPPDIHAPCKERLIKVIETQAILESIEAKMIRSDGEVIDVEVRTVPYHLKGKVYAQVIMQDITQRKIAEKLLNDREKLASLGQTAASIVHEVKNPLTSVKGFLQLLKESQSHSYLDTMESELEKALETLQNLLLVSKPNLHDEPFVSIALGKELESLLFLFQEKLCNMKVELNVRDAERTVVGKRSLLLKAFFNLIKNAIEAIPDKGMIEIEHYYENGWVHIKVRDTGVGIAEDKVKLLGTPFFTTKSDGTGLGVTQVFTTINEHGGGVSVQSVVGEGTIFHIRLPAE
ncbi:ATP-binding protein [Alkalihalobacillus sp. MEB130]|uniref:two-component system sensor histidine kinase NtrB n=1 Tax=Alkalihalobacillus sp. MEB130 TaxID=2976704 RepID=UPI0028DE362A|nr:ATP-binding protein [Alkalihalobacillus sp. MEB130]MDT8863053.1 ATP-binding protein [Alkalihalobacillus sp. MEB130]